MNPSSVVVVLVLIALSTALPVSCASATDNSICGDVDNLLTIPRIDKHSNINVNATTTTTTAATSAMTPTTSSSATVTTTTAATTTTPATTINSSSTDGTTATTTAPPSTSADTATLVARAADADVVAPDGDNNGENSDPVESDRMPMSLSSSPEALLRKLASEHEEAAAAGHSKIRIIEDVGVAPDGDADTVRASLLPMLFDSLPASALGVAQQDIPARIRRGRPLPGVPQLPGSSFSAVYKFLTVVAAVAWSRPETAPPRSWDASVWTDLSRSKFPAAVSNKPWIVNTSLVKSVLTAAPWNFAAASVVVVAPDGHPVSLAAIVSKLAAGYLVAVLYQGTHKNGVCAALRPVSREIPWPIQQARTTLDLVVGVDRKYVYLIESCGATLHKIEKDEFMQRWHACEKSSASASSSSTGSGGVSCSTGRAIFISTDGLGGDAAADQHDISSGRVINTNPDGIPEFHNALIF